MAKPLSRMSVAEIRERFARGEAPLTAAVLAKLKRDPRSGVRQIEAVLRRRFEKDRAERLRRDAMMNLERVLWHSGVLRVAGVDEVGMGPLAGPVVAAAVVFPPDTEIEGVDDSKRLDPETRERLAAEIRARAAGVGIGRAEVAEVDRLNVHRAGILAMRRALDALPEPPQHVLVDARTIPDLAFPQTCFDKGDGIDFSIAAASIVAKTHRDALMVELDRAHPGYGFARHKGYGTKEHQEAIRSLGPCSIHRRSFPFLREVRGECTDRFYELKDRLFATEDRDEMRRFEAELRECLAELPDGEQRKLKLLAGRRWRMLS